MLNLARKSLPELLPLISHERDAHEAGDLEFDLFEPDQLEKLAVWLAFHW